MEWYEAYKDSGVEWIGEIPTTWQMLRIQQCFAEERRINDGLESFHALKFSAGSIVPKPEKWDEDEIADTYARYRCVNPGTIMINNLNLNFDLKSLRVGLVEEEGIITSAYIAIVPGAEIEPRFANYVLKSWDYRKAFHNMGKGLRLTLDWHELSKYRIQIPSRSEQQAIANYLDAKTAEIDALVADCEREVGLLQEYRKAVITEAVTKGLDPDVPMKDSGVEWIGEIPDRWLVAPLKHIVVSIESGTSLDGASWPASENEKGVLTLSAVYQSRFDAIQNKAVSPELYERLSCPLRSGTLLISRCNTSEWVGTAAYVSDAPENLYLPDKLWQLTFASDFVCRFIQYALQANAARNYFAALSVGASSTMQNIAKTDLLATPIAIPNNIEVAEIVAYLDARTTEIDTLIDVKRSMTDKLREYRRSLISEAVTGKFKVPSV